MTKGLSMDQVFIKKGVDILEANLENEHFGVREFTKEMGINRSQLYRKLKAITGKSTSKFICEFRLQKAMIMLQNNEATVSEIAYRVGFNSPTYFNTCFNKYYGYPPGEVKFKDIETSNQDNFSIIPNTTIQSVKKPSIQKMVLLFSSGIVILFVISYIIHTFFLDNMITETTAVAFNDRSIAILPGKNLSNNKENQYFADGVMGSIQNHLNKIADLKVISETTMEKYRKTKKTAPKIAKELRVHYLLEASVQQYEDKVRIIAKLIDAINDQQVWSETYDHDLKDLLVTQSEIAIQIAKELKATLTSSELERIEKIPTENMEAYNLFSKGRLILVNNSRKKEDLELTIELNKQAVALDSNFAEAYGEMAHSIYLMAVYDHMNWQEANKKAKYYAEKAIKINPNCFRANAVKAMLLWRKDWAKAKEYHEKAIALNPNDAAVHLQYGRYFLFCPIPDYNKYLYYITIAQRLDPFSRVVGSNFFNALLKNDKIEDATEYLNKMGFLWSKEVNLSRKSQIKAYNNKDWTAVIWFFKTEIEKDPNNSFLYNQLGHAYDEILNDDINFIKFSKKAYELDSTNSIYALNYHHALVEGKNFKEAEKLFQTKNFKSLFSKKQKLTLLFHYYYHHENYKKVQEVLKDSLMANPYFYKAITYAQLGDKKNIDSLFKEYIWKYRYKAVVYAILKEKDSMYHFLEKIIEVNGIRVPNGRREFDPYRKEERYKALLKKHYLPITHWNE